MGDVFEAVLQDEKLLLARGSGYDRGGAGLHSDLRLSYSGGGGLQSPREQQQHRIRKEEK